MLKQNLYYIYISLYASINLVTGLHIIGSFAYMPRVDLEHFGNLVTGIIALSIAVLCFIGLFIRTNNKSKTLIIRRRMGELLIYVLLPLLILSLIINVIVTPLISLYVASILSVIAAMVTFLLVYRRLHSSVLAKTQKNR